MMNRRGRLFGLIAVAVIALGGSVASQELRPAPDVAAMSPEEIVQLRIDIMKEDGKLLIGAMKLQGGDEGVAAAEHLLHNIGILKTLFPEGTITAESNSLENIWTDREGFDAIFDAMAAKAEEMKTAAAAGDSAAYLANLQAAGKFCGDCHTVYRKAL